MITGKISLFQSSESLCNHLVIRLLWELISDSSSCNSEKSGNRNNTGLWKLDSQRTKRFRKHWDIWHDNPFSYCVRWWLWLRTRLRLDLSHRGGYCMQWGPRAVQPSDRSTLTSSGPLIGWDWPQGIRGPLNLSQKIKCIPRCNLKLITAINSEPG